MDRYSAGVCVEISTLLMYTLHTKGVAYTVRLSIDHRWKKKKARQGGNGQGRQGDGIATHLFHI